MSDQPDDPRRDSIPLLLARTTGRIRRGGSAKRGARSRHLRPLQASTAKAIGYLRNRLGAVGSFVAAVLVMFAIFADMLASDLPIVCIMHGRVSLFANVTQPAELVALGHGAIEREASFTLWPVVAHGPASARLEPAAEPAERRGDTRGVLAAPGGLRGHPFGTDDQGRDVFARVIHGTRTYLVFALGAVMLSLLLGGLLGSLAGLFGGPADALVGRAIETVSAFPPLVLVLGIQAAVPHPTVATLFLAIALTRWPEVARLFRAEVMQVATRDYVLAARALGASPLRVLRRHVIPNVRSQLIVLGAVGVPAVILIEASLDFLRVGTPAGAASWGETMSEFRDAPGAWWLLAFPGAFLFATVVALTLVGEAKRDQLDPRAG